MMRYFTLLIVVSVLAGCTINVETGNPEDYISENRSGKYFPILSSGMVVPILVSAADHGGVIRAARDLQSDLELVSGFVPDLILDVKDTDLNSFAADELILVGTMGQSPLIDRLIETGKLDVSAIRGKWESSVTTVVHDPFPDISVALVIAGSDKRGTIYGIYELSEQIGVSPWYYWADVVPEHKDELYCIPGKYILGEPAVKYRGIFINDEAPALAGWAHEKFGGFNHQFYGHVFELILRMKGNYLWPAMWGRAFYDDDSLNAPLAHEYGIVIGTTHHEPLMRAHVEWARYGNGAWDYRRNADTLRAFWKDGIERMGSHESIVSLGMRGDGDEPMTEGTAISLLEKIVDDQRRIIENVTGRDPLHTPQLWALYKEVQDYYDRGMRVPDDVTLLLCDDNWGNIRKLPQPDESHRPGGYGIYYHFDYVGGPRNYKWLNTIQIERAWEQMHLAYSYGADRIWIVNVGDIKPMELPTQFFLDYAWDPGKWTSDNIEGYYAKWATQQFGKEFAEPVAGILADYTKFNARRKPELLSPDTYSLIHFREAERMVGEYNGLAATAEKLFHEIPGQLKDAYYQLVLFPVRACANINEMYVSAARNRLYASQGRAATNVMAHKVRELFKKDGELTDYFHKDLAGGKWNHMMSQTHIGYTYWQQPDQNNMPDVIEISLPERAIMGVAIEGSSQTWPGSQEVPLLPVFDRLNNQDHYIEVFNRGNVPFTCTIEPSESWIIPEKREVNVEMEKRIHMAIDWTRVPVGFQRTPVEVTGPGNLPVTVYVETDNRDHLFTDPEFEVFVENNGYVSMEAAHFNRAVEKDGIQWKVVPNLGRTHSAVISTPVNGMRQTPGGGSPHLEYEVLFRDTGDVIIQAYLSPTLNFHNTEGLHYAVSVDDEIPRIVNMHEMDTPENWNSWVSNNIIIKSSRHHLEEPGVHTINWWLVDPGVVLQKIVIQTDFRSKASYLGPPESKRIIP